MKITRKILRRIIREERSKINEQPIGPEQGRQMQADQEFRAIERELMEVLSRMEVTNRNANIYSLIDELEDLASRG